MAPVPLPLAPGLRTRAIWTLAQGLGVAAYLAVVAGLFLAPERTVALFWRGLVPLLPVVFLIHPTIWRNVCPLGTLSMGVDGRPGGTPAPGDGGPRVGDIPSFWRPALLLVVLIALRPLGLDDSGPASATLLVGLGTAAVLGRRHPRKAGFCNRHCPLLAVERLYGQAPLVPVANARCDGCSLCMSRGCLDLSPAAASAQLLGPDRRAGGWLRTPLGLFAATFPGIVLGFHTLPPDPTILRVVGGLFVLGVSSGLLSLLAVRATGVSWRTGFRALAAAAAALHLAFAFPGMAEAWGLPAGIVAPRVAGGAMALAWFVRGGLRSPRVV